jgi:hypothetical protein
MQRCLELLTSRVNGEGSRRLRVASSLEGMRRWVGLGVIADHSIPMGCILRDRAPERRSRVRLLLWL